MTNTQKRHTSVLCFLALLLAAMLVTSLVQRFKNPHLVVAAPQQAPEPQAAAMSEIGQLMQKLQADPTNMDILLHLIEHLVQEERWDAADSFAARALALDIANAKTYYLLGVIKHNQGNHKEAAQHLEKSLSLKESAHIRYSLGVLYRYFLENDAEAKKHFEAALPLAEGNDALKQRIQEELSSKK